MSDLKQIPVEFLIVDDLEENLSALEALLQRNGLMIHKARSGRDALELLLVHDFSLAIIDVQMPEMDGFKLAELMRGTHRTQKVPIIFVTAAQHDHSKTFKGYEIGAVDFIFKPLDPHAVLSKVNVFFELGQQKILLRHHLDLSHAALAEAQASRHALAQANEELNQFAQIASHDLKEPLRTVASYLQLLSKKTEGLLDEESREFLDFVISASKRMSRLVDSLLEYSQVGHAIPKIKATNLHEALEAALGNLDAAISEAGAEVRYAQLPMVKADPSQMIQVFQNLIGNAVKFRKPGHALVDIEAEKLDNAWQITVKDNGIGVPSESAERIFNPLQRLHGRDEYPGSGIGLAVCRKIVEKHGGKIWAHAQREGASFSFTLPL